MNEIINKANQVKTAEKPFDRSSVITQNELETLLQIIASPAGFDPQVVYGLYFLFTSIQKLVDNDKAHTIHDLCTEALIYLYPVTLNADRGSDRLSEIIHKAYRAADFNLDGDNTQSQIFVDEEINFIKSPPPVEQE